ncbi:MAG: tRNA lysidine(34) synthetase TilS [Trueperaceae bacterium]
MPPRPMDQRVRDALAVRAPTARTVVVALSGGSDSVALLRALVGTASLQVVAAHVDHGLRPDSVDDACWVASFCEHWAVPLHTERIDTAAIARRDGRNLEAVGRTVRYAYLARVAREVGADAIATAHTRNDQAETVMLQLLRGSAHPIGIRPVRGRVVRPLLELSKSDLRGWLDGLGQGWREDASNLDVQRDRAWIRHRVLPPLEQRRPGAVARLARFGRAQHDQATFLADEATRRFGSGALARSVLAAAPAALRHEALVALVRRAGGGVDATHLDLLDADLAGAAISRHDLPGGVRVRLLRDRVDAIRVPSVRSGEEPGHDVDAPAATVVSSAGQEDGVPVDTGEELPDGLPASLLDDGRWRLRAPRAGDRIRLPGGTRTVADVLTDAQVPREERSERTVLADGSRVVWIEGVAVEDGLDEVAADPDRVWMRRALALADQAAAEGDLPVGAVVVLGGRVVGEGRNRRRSSGDPIGHAEIEAMRDAAARTGDWRLAGATLVVTLEPCPMCTGAALQTHLARIVYGAPNPRDGAMGSVVDLAAGPWKRVPERRGGVLAGAATRRLERFFADRRTSAPDPD